MSAQGVESWFWIGGGMTSYYAQNPTDFVSVSNAILTLMENEPDLHWSLLVDSAFDYEQSDAMTMHGVNCYQQNTSELAEVAPWLVPLAMPGASLEKTQQTLQVWLKHCSGRPMLSIVASKKSAEQIADDWDNLHFVQTSDKQRFLLRFADTRVLTALPTLLTTSQWATLTAPLVHWSVINRQGMLASGPLAPAGTTLVPAPFELSNKQVGAFTDAAEPDAVIDYLADNMSEVIPQQIAPAQLYTNIVHTLTLAKEHGVKDWSDELALVCAACLTLGESNKDPVLLNLLSEKSWHSGDLSDAMVKLGVVK